MGPSLLAKLCVLILCVGATACVLLTLRQQRLDAVHELAVLQRDMAQLDHDLFRFRARIMASVTPGQIEKMALALGDMRPIGVDPPVRPGDANPTAVASAETKANSPVRPPGRPGR